MTMHIKSLQIRYDISEYMAKLLLWLAEDGPLSTADIEARTDASAKALIFRLRKEADVNVQSRRGVGYWLLPEDKREVLRIASTEPGKLGEGDDGIV